MEIHKAVEAMYTLNPSFERDRVGIFKSNFAFILCSISILVGFTLVSAISAE